jgi:hypothetical protein
VLRRRATDAPGFRLPAGPLFAVLGTLICGWLLSTRSVEQAWILIALVAAGFVLRMAGRGSPALSSSDA